MGLCTDVYLHLITIGERCIYQLKIEGKCLKVKQFITTTSRVAHVSLDCGF